jgi:rRNA maturation RNase YbeY
LTETPFPEPESSDQRPALEIFNESDRPIPFGDKDHHWLLQQVEQHEGAQFSHVELVYVTADRIIEINTEHLDRDYATDIISFRYDEHGSDHHAVEGTLFCCPERITEQAEEWKTTPEEEFKRVFVHGLLHLLDYEDQTDDQRQAMRNRENYYLSQEAS